MSKEIKKSLKYDPTQTKYEIPTVQLIGDAPRLDAEQLQTQTGKFIGDLRRMTLVTSGSEELSFPTKDKANDLLNEWVKLGTDREVKDAAAFITSLYQEIGNAALIYLAEDPEKLTFNNNPATLSQLSNLEQSTSNNSITYTQPDTFTCRFTGQQYMVHDLEKDERYLKGLDGKWYTELPNITTASPIPGTKNIKVTFTDGRVLDCQPVMTYDSEVKLQLGVDKGQAKIKQLTHDVNITLEDGLVFEEPKPVLPPPTLGAKIKGFFEFLRAIFTSLLVKPAAQDMVKTVDAKNYQSAFKGGSAKIELVSFAQTAQPTPSAQPTPEPKSPSLTFSDKEKPAASPSKESAPTQPKPPKHTT